MDLRALLRSPIDMPAVAAHLDALSPAARQWAALSMSRAEQAALFDAAKGFRAITVDDIVPADVPPHTPVIHHGRNSLPLFRGFQKRFCRGREGRELFGYNHQLFRWFTGPGYFVAYDLSEGEVLIDYTRLPDTTIPSWPRVISNARRLSRWIYNGTQDTLRGVSAHVTIGRAARMGAPMPNWFVLCREDAARPGLPPATTSTSA